jgi:hypothetical protein
MFGRREVARAGRLDSGILKAVSGAERSRLAARRRVSRSASRQMSSVGSSEILASLD